MLVVDLRKKGTRSSSIVYIGWLDNEDTHELHRVVLLICGECLIANLHDGASTQDLPDQVIL